MRATMMLRGKESKGSFYEVREVVFDQHWNVIVGSRCNPPDDAVGLFINTEKSWK